MSNLREIRRLTVEVASLRDELADRERRIAAGDRALEDLKRQVRGQVGDLTKELERVQRRLGVAQTERAAAQAWIARLYRATGQAQVIGNDAERDPTIRHILHHPRLKQIVQDAIAARGSLDQEAVARIFDTIVHTGITAA